MKASGSRRRRTSDSSTRQWPSRIGHRAIPRRSRAARDFAEEYPAFAAEAGLAALRWIIHGYGYEITGADVWAAYSHTVKAAANVDGGQNIRHRILALIDNAGTHGGFVAAIIGRELGLP